MRKTGIHAKKPDARAAHECTAQPGRPVIWHGLAVPCGTAVPRGTGSPCHHGTAVPCVISRRSGCFGLFKPGFASIFGEASRGVSSTVVSTPNPRLFESKFRLELD